ncbi:MAG: hypothetical protein HHJ14_14515 [Cellulomonas sp.]|nr:hypothetical protein [Cellulomonas sp.]
MTDPYKTLALMAPQVADRDLDQVWDRIGPQVSGRHVGWWDARRPGRWLVGVAAAGGVATALVMWPTSTPSAFASWTPTPAVATAAQTAAAQGQCEVVLHGSVEQTQRYPTPVVNPWLPTSDAELAGRRVLVAEQRGTFTYVLSSNGAWTVGCLYSAALGDGSTTASTTRLSLFPPAPGAGTVDVLDRGGVGVPGGESAVLASGRAGRDVVGVDVVTPAGRTVTASVASGYWSAWWPADEKVDDSLNQARMIVHRKDGSTDEVGTLGSLVPKPSYADTDPTPAPASTAG